MALCENCGSIQIVRARSTPFDKVLSLVSGRKPFSCRRCGWRGRRNWNDPVARAESVLQSRVAPDPDLSSLDTGLIEERAVVAPPRLDQIVVSGVSDPPVHVLGDNGDSPRASSERRRQRRSRQRVQRGSRRETIGAVAISAAVVFVVLMFVLVGSCTSDPGA
jgi:hypothetical protein